MKIAYIIPLLFLSTIIYAQESKKATPVEDQTLAVKQIKEQEAKSLKETQENVEKKTTQTGLVSDHGLEVKEQASKSKTTANSNSGQLLPNTASLEDIKKTIPNRQANHSIKNSRNTNNTMIGLPNTATLEEIKKTIPKN
ncbi:hypothetical protein [Chryseobacterium oncorhynchi]|uniref:Uncharacterized protein n=1 Tax=Chryseobacterium oncorhynchi TaxID=741074 RepID=A0A316WSS3_9FLAO|nr:hypothetical protein [Chryseobacterium oncorhynchi]PWN64501.1 hypothetical protein C1638_011455 [Chryseobacterium oncorhynchi]